jgi:hypothetical protein
VDERDRRRQLAEEFQRALIGDDDNFPWGLTADRVAELRPGQDDIEMWLLAVHYPDTRHRSRMTRGRKGHFTRRLRKVWQACSAGYDVLDREGRRGYYEVWTTGNCRYTDPAGLGIVWAHSLDRAAQLADLLFRHVAGPNTYAPNGRGQIRVRFLGGSIGEGETEARARQVQSELAMDRAWVEARNASRTASTRAELLAARLDAIRACDLTPGKLK